MTIDANQVKAAMIGRWRECLASRAGIDPALLDGKGHPCPKCGGDNRFSTFNDFNETGGITCRQCFATENSDGLSALQWLTNCDFPTALNIAAEHAGINGNGKAQPINPLEAICAQKRMPVESAKAFGARVEGSTVVIPAYDEHSNECTTFRLWLENGKATKGIFEKDKPAGIFFPLVDGKPRMPAPGDTVLVAYSVKDAIVLHSLGFYAIGLPGCELSAKFTRLFRDVNVVMIPHRNKREYERCERNCKRLYGVAESIKRADLPLAMDGEEGDDARDVLAKKDGEKLLRQAIKDAQSILDKSPVIRPLTVSEMIAAYPRLRDAVIEGLVRQGETMNVIASPKIGKSWLVNDLAIHKAAGKTWLDTFEMSPGNVLILDNELHAETSANRIPKVAEARNIPLSAYGDRIQVANLRGQLTDIYALHRVFDRYNRGDLDLVILDAFYRAVPQGTDENENAAMTTLYNHIDKYALQLGCSFILVHHSSKGNQSGKAITDVGAGAGSQSRATDTHLILRPHEEAGAIVLDAAVRSWKPIEPFCLRWSFPLFNRADDLDPADLRPERPRRQRQAAAEKTPKEPEWTAERFTTELGTKEPKTKETLIAAAIDLGLTDYKAGKLLKHAVAKQLMHRWIGARFEPHRFATEKQPTLELNEDKSGHKAQPQGCVGE